MKVTTLGVELLLKCQISGEITKCCNIAFSLESKVFLNYSK